LVEVSSANAPGVGGSSVRALKAVMLYGWESNHRPGRKAAYCLAYNYTVMSPAG